MIAKNPNPNLKSGGGFKMMKGQKLADFSRQEMVKLIKKE